MHGGSTNGSPDIRWTPRQSIPACLKSRQFRPALSGRPMTGLLLLIRRAACRMNRTTRSNSIARIWRSSLGPKPFARLPPRSLKLEYFRGLRQFPGGVAIGGRVRRDFKTGNILALQQEHRMFRHQIGDAALFWLVRG